MIILVTSGIVRVDPLTEQGPKRVEVLVENLWVIEKVLPCC